MVKQLQSSMCVFGPLYSSKWAMEMGVKVPKDREKIAKLKEYVYANINTLENVYLAGGEPLLMKENKDFLDKLYEANPDCTIRVNTNLSKTQTGVMDSVCKCMAMYPLYPLHWFSQWGHHSWRCPLGLAKSTANVGDEENRGSYVLEAMLKNRVTPPLSACPIMGVAMCWEKQMLNAGLDGNPRIYCWTKAAAESLVC